MTNYSDQDGRNQTIKVVVFVDELTYSGSAFGSTPSGEQVFINKRIVDAAGVEPGVSYQGFLLPNFSDKRDMIPWRAMRLLAIEDQELVVEKSLLHLLLHELEQSPYQTAHELAERLEVSVIEIKKCLDENKDIIFSTPAYFLP